MTDPRVARLARLLVVYSAAIQKGDRVLIEAEVPAEPLVRALFEEILKAGGHPQLLLGLEGETTFTGLDPTFLAHADGEQLAHPPSLLEYAYQNFESRIRIHSEVNTKCLAGLPPEAIRRRREATRSILATQFERGRAGEFKWVTTLFPTQAYAQDANMSLAEYEHFVYRADHVEQEGDPVVYWQGVGIQQAKAIGRLEGAEQVRVQGPSCDLTLSVEGRRFMNASGRNNMPDGEIFTAPVEESANGWVEFTYPAVYQGRSVGGIRLVFEEGRVAEASAETGQDLLEELLETDAGSRYLGEFAIGTNYGVDRHTGTTLFDEKIGGTFHLALGRGYPQTGSQNESAIHWDMVCDLRRDSEITVDGVRFYKDGAFTE